MKRYLSLFTFHSLRTTHHAPRTTHHFFRVRLGLAALVLLTAVFRTHGLFHNDFHADEALFASWARHIAVWRDPLLLTQPVDKPPLLFYMQALFYPLQGPVEWAARLPNFIASLLLVPLVGIVAWRLFRLWEVAIFAASLIALSPLHIQFSASAFTDPLLTTLLFGAVAAVWVGKRPLPAGLLFGFAILTKHQAWLFLPLLLAFGWLRPYRRAEWLAWLRGFVPLLLLGWGWELVRNGRLTLLSTQVTNVGGFALTPLTDLPPRLTEWLTLTALMVSPLWLLLLLPLPFLLAQKSPPHLLAPSPNHSITPSLHHAITLTLFTLAYTTLHLLLKIPVWDRYLLPLLPLLAMLLATLFNFLLTRLPKQRPVLLAAVVLMGVALLPQAWSGRNGRLPIGARPFADSGAAVVAEALADEPYGTVLYDHWYSWHWRYHLFDKRVHLNWFEDADGLVEDLDSFYDGADARYIVLPTDGRETAVLQALDRAGYKLVLTPVVGETTINLYRIELKTINSQQLTIND